MARRAATLMGAGKVIAIDRIPERLALAERFGPVPLDYTAVDGVIEALVDMTGGRGPDACIDAVGMEAHGAGIDYAYDGVKQALRLERAVQGYEMFQHKRDGCIRSVFVP